MSLVHIQGSKFVSFIINSNAVLYNESLLEMLVLDRVLVYIQSSDSGIVLVLLIPSLFISHF